MRAKAKKHKLLASYFQLGNFAPDLRARQASIQLVDLAKAKDVQLYSLEYILRHTLKDLHDLQDNGIKINHEGEEYFFNCAVYISLGDNLGQNLIGGFAECFNTLSVCRMCDINIEGLRAGRLGQCRNPVAHSLQLQLVNANPDLCRTYGVYKNPVLRDLQGFDVTESLPSCFGHDLWEGVAVWLIEQLVSYCIRSRFFSLAQLNSRLHKLPYQSTDKRDKPNPLTATGTNVTCKQTMSQMYALSRLLPILIGDLVPENDVKWEVFLRYLWAQEMIAAPILKSGEVNFMAELIEDFLAMRKQEFTENEKPKHHMMRHYPEQFRKFGPLRNLSTLHLEQKHDIFIEVMRLCKNTKNIPHTMTYRHQCQALVARKQMELFKDEIKLVWGTEVDVDDLDDSYRDIIKQVCPVGNIQFGKALEFNSIRFGQGCAIAFSTPTATLAFQEIIAGAIVHQDPYILCEGLQIVQYHRHFNAYEVRRSGVYVFRRVRNVRDKFPIGIYNLPDKEDVKVVVLKHHIA